MTLDEKISALEESNKATNLILVKEIENVKGIRARYEKELQEKYSSDLLSKIVEINKIIKNAEALIGCSGAEGARIYAERFPSNVGKDKQMNTKGIKRLNLLNRLWKF